MFYTNKAGERWCGACNVRVAKPYMSAELRRVCEDAHADKCHNYVEATDEV